MRRMDQWTYINWNLVSKVPVHVCVYMQPNPIGNRSTPVVAHTSPMSAMYIDETWRCVRSAGNPATIPWHIGPGMPPESSVSMTHPTHRAILDTEADRSAMLLSFHIGLCRQVVGCMWSLLIMVSQVSQSGPPVLISTSSTPRSGVRFRRIHVVSGGDSPAETV